MRRTLIHLSVTETHDQLRTIVGLSTRAALGEVSTFHLASVDSTIARRSAYRASLGPHHTPMPARDPDRPFPEHAPSVYTTASTIVDKGDLAAFDSPVSSRDLALEGPVERCNSDPEGTGRGLTADDTDACVLDCDPIKALA